MKPKDDYQQRKLQEIAFFRKIENVNELPDIFHYWSHHHLKPLFDAVGITGVTEFFLVPMLERCRAAASESPKRRCKFVSLGSGHCEFEIEIASRLKTLGFQNFVLECLDITKPMLDTGKRSAQKTGVGHLMDFIELDLNTWDVEEGDCDVVMANQSLHHFVELELLFDKIAKAIGHAGVFVTSDIIGRNGHMRWPEALEIIQKLWAELPDRCKYNRLLSRFESSYENWDCSVSSFEGIRCQDILPLLIRHFHFDLFVAFGNLIDIFVDRAFGHNFDPQNKDDLAFIDRVATLDQQMIEAGTLSPTHMFAVMRHKEAVPAEDELKTKIYKHLSPEFCIRKNHGDSHQQP